MKTPRSYKDWVTCLELVCGGCHDEEVYYAMIEGSIQLEARVGVRLIKKSLATIQYRLNKLSDEFSRGLARSTGDLNEFTNLLLKARKEFKYLHAIASLSAFSHEGSQGLSKLVRDHADKMQDTLEDMSQKNDRTGQLGRIVRHNKVNNL